MQLLTDKLGGKVVPAGQTGNSEYGQSTLRLKANSKLFADTPEEQTVLMSHGDAVTEIPAGFHLVGDSADCPYAAIENTEKTFMVFNSTQKFVTQYMVMIFYVTLLSRFAELKVIGQWTTSLSCKFLRSAKSWRP